MDKIERILGTLAIVADAYMTEAGRADSIDVIDAVIAKAKAEAVNECIQIIEDSKTE